MIGFIITVALFVWAAVLDSKHEYDFTKIPQKDVSYINLNL